MARKKLPRVPRVRRSRKTTPATPPAPAPPAAEPAADNYPEEMANLYISWSERRQAERAQARQRARAVLCAQPKIRQVVARFSGSSDSGALDDAIAFTRRLTPDELSAIGDGAIAADLDSYRVLLAAADQQVLDSYLQYALNDQYGGWEINDGGYGTILLDVGWDQSFIDITRYHTETTSETSSYEAMLETAEDSDPSPQGAATHELSDVPPAPPG